MTLASAARILRKPDKQPELFLSVFRAKSKSSHKSCKDKPKSEVILCLSPSDASKLVMVSHEISNKSGQFQVILYKSKSRLKACYSESVIQ